MSQFWLTVGALDTADVRAFRDVLASLAARPDTHLTIDLAGLDDSHHLTAVAVLSVAADKMQGMGSVLTICNPPSSIAAVFDAVPIPVIHEPLGASGASGIELIRLGR